MQATEEINLDSQLTKIVINRNRIRHIRFEIQFLHLIQLFQSRRAHEGACPPAFLGIRCLLAAMGTADAPPALSHRLSDRERALDRDVVDWRERRGGGWVLNQNNTNQ